MTQLLVALGMLALVSCSSAVKTAPPAEIRGTYEAESGGPFLWVAFADATQYALLRAANCSLASGASQPCQESGTYTFTSTTLTLTPTAGAAASYPLSVATASGMDGLASLDPTSDLKTQGNVLGGGDGGIDAALDASGAGAGDATTSGAGLGGAPVALTNDGGGVVLTSGVPRVLTIDGAPVNLVQTSTTAPASGYLVGGPSRSAIGPNVLCGGTLLSSTVVLTAAHCADKLPSGSVWAFGVGDVGGTLYYVQGGFHDHPAYVDASKGGLAATLRENDLAYLILEGPAATGVVPIFAPMLGRDCPNGAESAIVYRPARQVDDACIELALTLQVGTPDPIYEVHPTGDGLCPASGDDGSALYQGGSLVGTFAGSVTAVFSSCTSVLNGYESATGHQSFLDQAMAAGG